MLCPLDINEKTDAFASDFLAGAEGLEPSRTVLETGMLPLHYAPKYIAFAKQRLVDQQGLEPRTNRL